MECKLYLSKAVKKNPGDKKFVVELRTVGTRNDALTHNSHLG